jgi:hypothetical protein
MGNVAIDILKLRLENFSKYLANVDNRDRSKLKRSIPYLYADIAELEKEISEDQRKEYNKIKDDCKRLAEQFQVSLNQEDPIC